MKKSKEIIRRKSKKSKEIIIYFLSTKPFVRHFRECQLDKYRDGEYLELSF